MLIIQFIIIYNQNFTQKNLLLKLEHTNRGVSWRNLLHTFTRTRVIKRKTQYRHNTRLMYF